MGLLEARDDVVILEVSPLLGELEDVVSSPLPQVVVRFLWVDLNLGRNESLPQPVSLDQVLGGCQTGHDVPQKLII